MSINDRGVRYWVLVGLIVAASLAVRLVALAYWQTGAIENEGAEYARLAENLRSGVGFVGIAIPGTQLLFNPLFPLLIAATSFVTHDYEWAARLVSLVLGALLPLPVFGIASRLFNRRVGLIAALLTVLHPLLVNLSFTTFSEGPYTTLLLSAVYLVVRALNNSATMAWLWVGAAFGLAYLLRAEAVAPFLIAVVFAFTATQGGTAFKCKRALAAIGVFLTLALPEIVFIHKLTGKVLLEGKSTLFFDLGTRILSAEKSLEADHLLPDGQRDDPPYAPDVVWEREGLSYQSAAYKWAHFAIDTHLNGTGTPMRSNAEVIRGTRITLKGSLHLVEAAVRHKAPVVVHQLLSSWLGPPFLPALALLGALRRPWRRPQASSRLFVMLVPIAPLVSTFSALWDEPRYYFLFVPFLLIWASNGLVEVGLWTKASGAAVGWRIAASPAVSRYIIPGLIGLTIIIYPVRAVRTLRGYFTSNSPSSRLEKEVGLWIGHQQSRSVRIMDLSLPLTFHADAQWAHFPYCDGETAIRFLDAAQVDYVVLRREGKWKQYYEDWLTHGIPDPRAELLRLPPADDHGEFVVYRWHRRGL
jgi:4-amino-4-deoxy-L-arabinose transferase-like glycosyltransferase